MVYRMKSKRRVAAVLVVFLMCLIMVSGCGAGDVPVNTSEDTFYNREEGGTQERAEETNDKLESIYNDAMDRLMADEEGPRAEGKDIIERLTNSLFGGFYRAYLSFKTMAPFICVVSFAVGLVLFLFSTKNKRLRRLGLFGFIIGLPMVVVFIVYGIGILNGVLIY